MLLGIFDYQRNGALRIRFIIKPINELKCTTQKLKRIETKTTKAQKLAQLHAWWSRYEILSRLMRLNHELWITLLWKVLQVLLYLHLFDIVRFECADVWKRVEFNEPRKQFQYSIHLHKLFYAIPAERMSTE